MSDSSFRAQLERVLQGNATTAFQDRSVPVSILRTATTVGMVVLYDGKIAKWSQLSPSMLAQQGATLNQVLTWNGTQWVPGASTAPSDASTTVKGITKMSVAPAVAASPIAVGDNDPRMTDARTPTAHAASHASAGSDPITIAESQVTNLTTDLAAKAALASPVFTGTPSLPTGTTGITQASTNSSTRLATTAFVKSQRMSDLTLPNAAVPMNTQKFTGLPAGSAAGDSLAYDQLFTASGVTLLGAMDSPSGFTVTATSKTALGSTGWSIKAAAADTQPVMQATYFGGQPSLLMGLGGSTVPDFVIARTATGEATVSSGLLRVPTGTAGTGGTAAASQAYVETATGSASSNRPAVRATRTSVLSTTTGVEALVTWNGEDFDTDSMHDTVSNTSRLVASSTGTFQIDLTLAYAANATGVRYGLIRKNSGGSSVGGTLLGLAAGVPNNGVTGGMASGSIAVQLTAGDYIEVFSYQNSGGALDLTVNSHVEMAWVGGSGAAWGNAGASAYQTAAQSHPTTATWQPVTWDSELWDIDGMHSVASNTARFVCTVAGKYVVTGNINFALNTAGVRAIRFAKVTGAGTTYHGYEEKTAVQTDTTGVSTSAIVDLSVGDYIQCEAYQNSGAALAYQVGAATAGSIQFSAARVGYQTNPNKAGSRVTGGFQEATSDYSTGGGTSLTITVTHDGVTPIRLTAYGYCTNTTAARLCGFAIMDGATVIQDARSIRVPTASMNIPVQISRVVDPQPAGTVKTYTVVNATDAGSVPTIYGSVGGRYIEATWAG